MTMSLAVSSQQPYFELLVMHPCFQVSALWPAVKQYSWHTDKDILQQCSVILDSAESASHSGQIAGIADHWA